MKESELRKKMNDLAGLLQLMETEKAAFEEKTKDLSSQIEDLKSELKSEFLSRKVSLSSDLLIAKYRKGAVRWDSTGLKAYAKTHPELEEFQKTGEPTVAFYLRKEEEGEDTLMTMVEER